MANNFLMFGVSAAGKTSLCVEILKRCTNVEYISASDILVKLKREASFKQHSNNDEIQRALCRKIALMCCSSEKPYRLIDGHLANSKEGVAEQVPKDAIEELQLTALFYLNASAALVRKRRALRKLPDISLQSIQEEIKEEQEAGKSASIILTLPIFFIKPNALEGSKEVMRVMKQLSETLN